MMIKMILSSMIFFLHRSMFGMTITPPKVRMLLKLIGVNSADND